MGAAGAAILALIAALASWWGGSTSMPTITDNFNRADAADIATSPSAEGWSWTLFRSGRVQILNNELRRESGTGPVYRAESSLGSADCFAQIRFPGNVGTNQHGVLARMSASTAAGYMFSATATEFRLWTFNGTSTFDRIETVSGVGAAAGDTLRIECEGTTIRGLVNGVEVISVTDSTYTTGDRSGLYFGATQPLDDFAAGSLAAPVVALTPTAPVAQQVRQRGRDGLGDIPVAGTYTESPGYIEARFNGGAWQTIDASPSGGNFAGTLTNQLAGRGSIEVRADGNDASIATVANVGIGDVLYVWGQSNADGRGTNPQSIDHPTLTASKYTGTWAATTGDPIRPANTGNGSIWPLVLDAMMDRTGVPVAIVHLAQGGTGLVSGGGTWSVGGTLQTTFQGYLDAAGTGGAIAVVTWQGEHDSKNGTSEADYLAAYIEAAHHYAANYDAPTVCIQVQSSPGGGTANPHNAQAAALAQSADVIGLVNTDDLIYPDDLHATTDEQLDAVADRVIAEMEDAGLLGGAGTSVNPFASAAFGGVSRR